MVRKYCGNCKQWVLGEKWNTKNALICLMGFLLGVIPGIIFLFTIEFRAPYHCPICKDNNWIKPPDK